MERQSGHGEGITNNVCINDELLVLTGPNMSGKSTLLRSIIAAVLLAHAGLPVPALSATVPRVRLHFSLPQNLPLAETFFGLDKF